MDGQLRLKDRQSRFMATEDSEEGRRKRRVQEQVDLRQKRKDDLLAQKRMALDSGLGLPTCPPLLKLEEAVEQLFTGSPYAKQQGAARLRELLSAGDQVEANLKTLVDTPDFLQHLVQIIRFQWGTPLQLEVAWLLTKASTGSPGNATKIVQAGGIPALMEMLAPQVPSPLKQQAMAALANIANDWTVYRDMILEEDAIVKCLHVIEKADQEGSLQKMGIFCINHLVKGKPAPPLWKIQACIPILKEVVVHFQEDNVLTDALWAFCYITDGQDESIFRVLNTGLVPHVLPLLESPHRHVVLAAMKLIGNIISDENALPTDEFLKAGFLRSPGLFATFLSPQRSLRREAAWTLSNVLAGEIHQVQAVIDANILPHMLGALEYDDEAVRKEVIWCLCNLTNHQVYSQICYLVEWEGIENLCDYLRNFGEPGHANFREISQILVALTNICQVWELEWPDAETNAFADKIEMTSILSCLTGLAHYEVEKARDRLLTNYFPQLGHQQAVNED